MNRVFSGVQPTGDLHLGNYLGAIRNWVNMQNDNECIFCIVDLHAITLPQDPVALKNNIRNTAAMYIACGVDPKESIIFNQSTVPAHAELSWILSCYTTIGRMNRMTQFKEKAGKKRDNAVLGLYCYPVLMAADILAYKATHVPVGDDQKQHLELTRDIASIFNERYRDKLDGEDFFPFPEPIILGEATRIMSLRNGRNKMSKSDESEYSRINLTDDPDTIALKIRKAKSDAGSFVTYDIENRPEASNLITIYAAITHRTIKETAEECRTMNFATLKKNLTDAIISHLEPIQLKYNQLQDDKTYLDTILKNGTERANNIADPILKEVKELVGFYIP